MQRIISMILTLTLIAVPGPEHTKVPQSWDAKTIPWQKVDPDGTIWAVLEGHSKVAGEAFTYAAFIPAGFHKSLLACF